jgi:hypothetical protein
VDLWTAAERRKCEAFRGIAAHNSTGSTTATELHINEMQPSTTHSFFERSTILDLGPWGAVYTNGWDRQVIATGPAAKVTKQTINCQRIYPPRTKKREDILAAAAPVVQAPPEIDTKKS